MADLEGFVRRLGHRFADPGLLEQALTHRSAGGANNERLEFLGDALLGLVVAEELYRLRPRASEGDLSRLRASLVRRETLAEIARELALGEWLRLGQGELKSGGYRRDSVLANGLEAVIGAVLLDGGHEAARSLLLQLYATRLAELPARAALKDPKTRLQEYLQAHGQPLPDYEVVAVDGEEHRRTFTVACRVDGQAAPFEGTGLSRRKAEQQAASRALAGLAGEA